MKLQRKEWHEKPEISFLYAGLKKKEQRNKKVLESFTKIRQIKK